MLEIIRDYAHEQLMNAEEAQRARLQLVTVITDLEEHGAREYREQGGLHSMTI